MVILIESCKKFFLGKNQFKLHANLANDPKVVVLQNALLTLFFLQVVHYNRFKQD
jgi:hypothetical protein